MSTNPIVNLFQGYAKGLDDYNDRSDRLRKVSRDITTSSKKLIFLLQRSCTEDKEQIMEKARADAVPLRKLIEQVAQEIDGQDYYKYVGCFSWGLQEYLEAASFMEFLESGQLLTIEKAENDIKKTFSKELKFSITMEDFLLGIADLTGELMRACITAASNRQVEFCTDALAFMRVISNGIKSLPNLPYIKEWDKKLDVMETSLKKVEYACFNMQVRGSEIPIGSTPVSMDD
eukprot:TRINITY_DN8621_c0_g1_i1.p1 TRINITY_DN8621_c0_g1~~TRINITY_DN8621_c0_g1_i1.p1  ORF type:complete len:267 (+),score=52.92 TRINITY_DN8621_c0_g1_i1:107-802(+)